MFVVSIALTVLLPVKVFAGFGVSPAGINRESIKMGTRFVQEMTISRSDPNEELVAIIRPELGDLEQWVTFEPSNRIELPIGATRVKMRVLFDIPENTPVKPYYGLFRIIAAPKSQVKGISVVKGARIDIKLATTDDDFYDLKIRAVSIPDTYEEEDLFVELKVKNDGNAFTQPSRVTISVTDINENPVKMLETTTIDGAPPYLTSVTKATFKDHGLLKGDYFGQVRVYQDSDVLIDKKVVFKVHPKKIFEEVCSGAPEVLSSNTDIIFGASTLSGLIILVLLTLRQLKLKEKRSNKKILTYIIIFLIYVILLMLTMLVNVFGLFTRKCETVLTNPVKLEEMTTPPMDDTTESSVQGLTINPFTDTSEREFQNLGILRVGQGTEDGQYRIYKDANLSTEVIYLADEGENLSVLQEVGQWYQVLLPDQSIGWLPKVSVKDTVQQEL